MTKWLRRIALVYLAALGLLVLQNIVAASANASTPNAVSLAAHVPWALVAAVLAGNVIPYLSALATRAPSWLTGVITAALSFVAAVCAEVANVSGAIDWRAVLATAGATWLVAAVHHSKILKGTAIETKLHRAGVAGDAGATQPVVIFGALALVLVLVLLLTGHWILAVIIAFIAVIVAAVVR